ncbi:hypothetical protein GGX14DRAFT_539187 [Mycena pura]|uniref:Uncharacterized protein n=1 Tax=Mycena pura TaxID=153505 RepID=A0AAD6YR70_9AGAR|nr:hypothetical protein GGX14DRAFT_539187 [Mycena pura]
MEFGFAASLRRLECNEEARAVTPFSRSKVYLLAESFQSLLSEYIWHQFIEGQTKARKQVSDKKDVLILKQTAVTSAAGISPAFVHLDAWSYNGCVPNPLCEARALLGKCAFTSESGTATCSLRLSRAVIFGRIRRLAGAHARIMLLAAGRVNVFMSASQERGTAYGTTTTCVCHASGDIGKLDASRAHWRRAKCVQGAAERTDARIPRRVQINQNHIGTSYEIRMHKRNVVLLHPPRPRRTRGAGSDGSGGVDTPGVGIRAGVDAGRGRVFRVTQTPRGGGGRTAVGAWTRAGVPCDETPRTGAGVGRRWGAWTRRVWVGTWAFARAGMDTWHGRAFRATQTPCGGGGRTAVEAWTRAGVPCDETPRTGAGVGWRGQGPGEAVAQHNGRTHRVGIRKDGGSHVRDAGWWRRASQATAPGIDNEAPWKTVGAAQRQGRRVAKGGGDMQPAGPVRRVHRQWAEGGQRRARCH